MLCSSRFYGHGTSWKLRATPSDKISCSKIIKLPCTMQLEVNGAFSSSKRTKHIKAHYFFIKDEIESGEVSVEYCPTEMMWADVLNKPKSGRPFRLDRSFLMNVPVDHDNMEELLRTHDDLLPKEDRILKAVILSSQRLRAQPRQGVCWAMTRLAKPRSVHRHARGPRNATPMPCDVPRTNPSGDPVVHCASRASRTSLAYQ